MESTGSDNDEMESTGSDNQMSLDCNDVGSNTDALEMLKAVGLDSFAIDPLSLDALSGMIGLSNTTNNPALVGLSIKLANFDKYDAPIVTNGQLQSTTTRDENISQNLIWEHMELQTKLLVHLHKRMELISTSLNRLESTQKGELSQRQQGLSPSEWLQHQNRAVYQPRNNTLPAEPAVPVFIFGNQQAKRQQEEVGREQQHIPPAVPQQMFIFSLYSKMIQSCQTSYEKIHTSKGGKIFRLFIELKNRRVRNFDHGLFVKVLFMLGIFMFRIQRRGGKPKDGGFFSNLDFSTKFSMLATCIMIFFLVQNGFMKFMYNFLKENYAGRIMDGEELDVNTVIAEEETKRERATIVDQNENNNNERDVVNNANNIPNDNPLVGGIAVIQDIILRQIDVINRVNWRRTFLGGAIIPNNQEERQRISLIRFFHDFVFLIGSFFLSIFPMWRPVPLPPTQPIQTDEQQQEPEGAGGPNDGPGVIPRIQPPDDPAEEEEEPHEHDD